MGVSDVAAAAGFLRAVFGATGEVRDDGPAQIRIGNSVVMVSEAGQREAFPAFLYVYVDDADGGSVYLNGADLPREVYASSDVNDLIAALLERLGADGDMQSYWEGPRETALYLYGASAARMDALTANVLARFPLAQRCRVVLLGLTLPSRN
jgi:hypothetical protein